MPTPESIGQAEQRLHEGSGSAEMLLLLRRARDLDRAGDPASCDDAASALGRALNVTGDDGNSD